MKAHIILYSVGAGGNFLGRVLSLDDCTIPVGAVGPLTTEERYNKYCYNNIIDSIGGKFNQPQQNGLSAWVNIELTDMYMPMKLGMELLTELDSTIVEPTHPHLYKDKIQHFGPDDEIHLLYVDPTDCIDWIVDQRLHKGATLGETRKQIYAESLKEIELLKELAGTSPAISLKKIIQSDTDFLAEYHRVCEICNLQSHETYALGIYQSWRQTWSNNV